MSDVSREFMNRILSRVGFNLPDKGNNYVRSVGRGADKLLLVASFSERDQVIRLRTVWNGRDLIWHADTKTARNGWERTIMRKVNDASVNGNLQAARQSAKLYAEVLARTPSLKCPTCSGPVGARNTERGGFFWKCADTYCPQGFVSFRDGMGLDQRASQEVFAGRNVYETLIVRPPFSRLKKGLAVRCRWLKGDQQQIAVDGAGTFFCRRSLRAFGLLWNPAQKVWVGPAGTEEERKLLRAAVESVGMTAEADNTPVVV